MAGKQPAAVVELGRRRPAAGYERAPRDNRLSMDGWDASAHVADAA